MTRKLLVYLTLPLLLLLSNSSGNSAPGSPRSVPDGFNPGPDIIAGNMVGLEQFGTVGTQRGLATAITSCNTGKEFVGFFAMPDTNHPAVAQNLYRMSSGSGNTDRFEQIGQSWVKHTYGAKQANGCSLGCLPGGDFTHLGVGCSDTYFNFQSAEQGDLGSRAWINPFTGVFSTNARNHTGHNHTAVSHMMVVESSDLDQTINQGATYYAELAYVTPNEYTWCQAHPGECNMYNNTSYLQYSVTGTTNFSFSQIGSPVRMTPAVAAWTGATIQTIEPEPGVDGRAFVAYKVTGPVAGLWHYEYAIYNENLDRAIQSFRVPMLLLPGSNGAGPGPQNIGFHAPPQHPGFPADGTQGDAGFSSAAWIPSLDGLGLTWSSETFAANPNANAIRWGTLYNFRFDSNSSPVTANATIGFFKTGTPITVEIQGPGPTGGPSPTPTPTATPTPTPTPTTVQVGLGGTTFTPDIIFIQPGDTVEWVWASSNHSVTSGIPGKPDGLFDSGIQDVPFTFSQTFATLGSFPYYCRVHGTMMVGTVNVVAPTPSPTPTPTASPTPGAQALNLATRMRVLTGDDVGIGGLIITGSAPKQVLFRALGPSNAIPEVQALPDPVLELHGPAGIVVNDNWRDTQESEILATGLAPSNNLESAILVTLSPGAYTAIVRGKNNTTGVGVVEVYDLGQAAASKLANLSTRAFVSTGADIMIAGFILGGNTGDDHIIVRGIGPSLTALSVPNALANPMLELRNSSGTLLASNNDWQDDPAQAAELTAAGLAPTSALESGISATLPPGSYTGLLSGVNSGTGLGLIEVYDLGSP